MAAQESVAFSERVRIPLAAQSKKPMILSLAFYGTIKKGLNILS